MGIFSPLKMAWFYKTAKFIYQIVIKIQMFCYDFKDNWELYLPQ